MLSAKSKIRNDLLRPHASSLTPGFGSAFTLVEVLIVVGILALLVAALVGVSGSIKTQKNTALTKNCLNILDAALAEFYEITGKYPVDSWGIRDTSPGCLIAGATQTGGSDDPGPSELLYLQLSILPQTRDLIAKLPDQLLVEPLDPSDNPITVRLASEAGNTLYLRRIVDAWETPLNYDLGENPPIWSSGSDKISGTKDDISK